MTRNPLLIGLLVAAVLVYPAVGAPPKPADLLVVVGTEPGCAAAV